MSATATSAPLPMAHTVRPDVLLLAVAAAVVTNLWRLPLLFPILSPLRPVILTGLAAMVLFVLTRDPARTVAAMASPITLPLLALTALMIAGIPTSLDPQLSITYFVKEILPRLLLTLLLVGSVRTRADLEWLILATIAGCWIYTVMMILRIPVGPEGYWTKLVEYDNNDFAMLAVCTVPLAAYFMRPTERWSRRLAGAATLGLMLFIVGRSGSRGAFLGLVAVLGYLALRYRAIPARTRLMAVVAGVLVLAVAGGTRYRGQLATLLNPTQDYNWSGRDYNGRLELWKRGLGYIADRPVLGVGLDAYTVAEGELSAVARRRLMQGKTLKTLVAHNMYIQVGAELGLPALAAFLFVLWRGWRAMGRVRRAVDGWSGNAAPESALAVALSAALLGYLVCGVFLASGYFTFLFVLLGFVAALCKLVLLTVHRRAVMSPVADHVQARWQPAGVSAPAGALPRGR